MKHYSFLILRENYFNCDINSISNIEELILKKKLNHIDFWQNFEFNFIANKLFTAFKGKN